jgi:hypothetical protein
VLVGQKKTVAIAVKAEVFFDARDTNAGKAWPSKVYVKFCLSTPDHSPPLVPARKLQWQESGEVEYAEQLFESEEGRLITDVYRGVGAAVLHH